MLHTHCPTLGFFYLATISACAFSGSCEWFPHLSIAITPNNSLPASWVKNICLYGYEGLRGSLKCHCLFAITPPPKKKKMGSQARVWLLVYWEFQSPPLSWITQVHGQLIITRKSEGIRTSFTVLHDVKHFKYGVLMSLLRLIAFLVFLIVVLVVFFLAEFNNINLSLLSH